MGFEPMQCSILCDIGDFQLQPSQVKCVNAGVFFTALCAYMFFFFSFLMRATTFSLWHFIYLKPKTSNGITRQSYCYICYYYYYFCVIFFNQFSIFFLPLLLFLSSHSKANESQWRGYCHLLSFAYSVWHFFGPAHCIFLFSLYMTENQWNTHNGDHEPPQE